MHYIGLINDTYFLHVCVSYAITDDGYVIVNKSKLRVYFMNDHLHCSSIINFNIRPR